MKNRTIHPKRSEFLDPENKVVNINNWNTTELPFNAQVTMPNALSMPEEVQIQQFKKNGCSERSRI